MFKSKWQISEYLGNPKDKIYLEGSGIYQIPCSCYMSYIGMSSRKISTRKREHIRSVKNGDFDKSAIAEHVRNTKHTIDFDCTKIIAKGANFYDLAIRESIEIFKHQNLINREKGYYLSPNWHPVLEPEATVV